MIVKWEKFDREFAENHLQYHVCSTLIQYIKWDIFDREIAGNLLQLNSVVYSDCQMGQI